MLPTEFQFILLRGFQRRRLKCEKFTDGRIPSDGNSSGCLWQGELKKMEVDLSYCTIITNRRKVNGISQYACQIDIHTYKNQTTTKKITKHNI